MRIFWRKHAHLPLDKYGLSEKDQEAITKKFNKILNDEVAETKRSLTQVIAFVPSDGKGKHACYIDPKVGWVERKVFKNYKEYVESLK